MEPISSAVQSVGALASIAKAIVTLSKDVAVNEKAQELLGVIISLQGDMLSLQSEYGKALKEKGDLEQQIKDLSSWENEKDKYETFTFISDAIVYIPKEPEASPYVKNWYCAHCFDNLHKKSFLQRKEFGQIPTFQCHNCGNVIKLSPRDTEAKNEAHNYTPPPKKQPPQKGENWVTKF